MSEGEKWILGCTIVMALCTVGALIIAVIAINKKSDTRIFPDPLNVRTADEFVTEDKCNIRHAANARSTEEVHQQLKEVERQLVEMEESRETQRQLEVKSQNRIYVHIDSVRRELSDKIEAMPSRIIADLRNSKGLLT